MPHHPAAGPELRTPRLVLRRWRDADRAPFAALNADPAVMTYFPATLDREQSDALVDRIEAGFEADGFGLWAVEVPGVAPFIGFVGLARQDFPAPFTPCVEIGWRLDRPWWHHGYAAEGARAALAHGFGPAGLTEILSWTTATNLASRAVMERLGMHHDEREDFDHPRVAEGHPLRPHVLYRLDQRRWAATEVASGPKGR